MMRRTGPISRLALDINGDRDSMQSFTYMAAPLRKNRQFKLDRFDLLDMDGGNHLDLATITSARFASGRYGKYQTERLELISGQQKLLIPITLPQAGPRNSQNYLTWLGLVLSTLDLIADTQPELKIKLAETKAFRWIMFAIGVGTMLTAVGLIALAIATDVPTKKMIGGGLIFVIMAGVGFGLAKTFNPFEKEAVLTAEQLKTVLAA
jgi:hypothetical protein